MKYGLIGEKLGHSFSKEIHSLIADYKYDLKEISKNELDDFFQKKDFSGINVTIPYKESVIKYIDTVSAEAQSIGAVNTIVNRNGKLFGYNTDFFGLKRLIKKTGIDLRGKAVYVLGTGGTSKTAKAVCESLNAKSVIKVSRSSRDGAITYDELYNNADLVEVIINTTPAGTYPDIRQSAVRLEGFKKLTGVIDVVYNPLKSKFVRDAERLSIKSSGGLYMLVAQAIRASELFLDKECEEGIYDEVYSKIYMQKQNVVLTGMPSSGKSTVGKILAKKMRREFVDTDSLIEKTTGKKIPDIINGLGEAEFRKIETSCVKEASKLSNKVIATGGGVVLNDENVDSLKQNGKIFFIDRPLENLIPTDDRPLSSTIQDVEKLYKERYGIYRATADEIIDASFNADDVAEIILRSVR